MTNGWYPFNLRFTPTTLSSTLCAILSCSADAIRASSCVNLSNLSRVSSMSVFPINFFRYFSTPHTSLTKVNRRKNQLTHSAPLHFFCRHPNDDQYLRHDFRRYPCHSGRWWHPDVNLEPTEEVFDLAASAKHDLPWKQLGPS